MFDLIVAILAVWLLCTVGKVGLYLLINLIKYGIILFGVGAIIYSLIWVKANTTNIVLAFVIAMVGIKIINAIQEKVRNDRRNKNTQQL